MSHVLKPSPNEYTEEELSLLKDVVTKAINIVDLFGPETKEQVQVWKRISDHIHKLGHVRRHWREHQHKSRFFMQISTTRPSTSGGNASDNSRAIIPSAPVPLTLSAAAQPWCVMFASPRCSSDVTQSERPALPPLPTLIPGFPAPPPLQPMPHLLTSFLTELHCDTTLPPLLSTSSRRPVESTSATNISAPQLLKITRVFSQASGNGNTLNKYSQTTTQPSTSWGQVSPPGVSPAKQARSTAPTEELQPPGDEEASDSSGFSLMLKNEYSRRMLIYDLQIDVLALQKEYWVSRLKQIQR